MRLFNFHSNVPRYQLCQCVLLGLDGSWRAVSISAGLLDGEGRSGAVLTDGPRQHGGTLTHHMHASRMEQRFDL